MARSQVGEWVDERGTYRTEAHATAAAGQGRGGKVREGLLQQRASLAIAPTDGLGPVGRDGVGCGLTS